jgi:hypothetical protein
MRARTITISAMLVAIASSWGIVTVGTTTSAAATTAKANTRSWAGSTDLAHLHVGDGRVTTRGARRGYVYSCQAATGGGPNNYRPWVSGSSWSYLAKPRTAGNVDWSAATFRVRTSSGQRLITGNGLPSHGTGIFPMTSSDPASAYGPNPSTIGKTTIDLVLPSSPRVARSPSCVPGGPIGVLTTGAILFNALDAEGNDAPAHEIQDRCGGHPENRGTYHYHALSNCVYSGPAGRHSSVIGWALDGFPITGPRGERGVTMTNARLDACHGHTGTITVNGRRVRTYHYHATMEYPYTLGCFRGSSVITRR